MSEAVIQVDHVWKKFRRGEMHDSLRDLIPAVVKGVLRRATGTAELKKEEFWALRDLTFEVPRGQSLGVIGPNGAGKSTLLKTLTKVLRPNRGTCQIHGRVSALIEVGAGFHPDLTGRENMALSGAILGMTQQEIKAKEESIIDFAGIPEFIDTPVKRYSSGMTARLGFAIAAHLEPDVLLVDEVLSVGDARFRDKCIRHMKNLMTSNNVTVVFISHILDQVQALCPNTLVLNKGQAVFMGPTSQAVRVYLDLLANDDQKPAKGQGAADIDVSDIKVLNSQGQDALEVGLCEPMSVQFTVELRTPMPHVYGQINITSINGTFLSVDNSIAQKVTLPNKETGRWTFTCHLPANPLGQGEYQIGLKVFQRDTLVWGTTQPRIVSVRGGNQRGCLVHLGGKWTLDRVGDVSTPATPAPPATPATAAAGNASQQPVRLT
jgi:lipopolysaccharide transport system ATP-binding protein